MPARPATTNPAPYHQQVSETPATFHTAPSPLGSGGLGIFGGTAAQRQAAGAAAVSTAFPSFGGIPANHTAGGNQYSRASSMVSIASSMGGGEDRDVEIPAHYPRAKAASRAVSALDLGASLLSPPDSP